MQQRNKDTMTKEQIKQLIGVVDDAQTAIERLERDNKALRNEVVAWRNHSDACEMGKVGSASRTKWSLILLGARATTDRIDALKRQA